MKALLTALQEVYGLFVEDGSLAVAILLWIGFAALLFPHLPEGAAAWRAPVFFAGVVLLLLENVWRSARQKR
ncbi:MAG TPA: hypothetical protein VFA07_10085 [Chthonomonadaceae bacterium]|nr:hypothetical protein [Chthonomonadaceae bacterium]